MATINGRWLLKSTGVSVPALFSDNIHVNLYASIANGVFSQFIDCTNLQAVNTQYGSYQTVRTVYATYNEKKYVILKQHSPSTNNVSWNSGGSDAFRTFDFGPEDQTVSDELYNWITANAVKFNKTINGTFTFNHVPTASVGNARIVFTSNGHSFDTMGCSDNLYYNYYNTGSSLTIKPIEGQYGGWFKEAQDESLLTFTTVGDQSVSDEIYDWIIYNTTPPRILRGSVDLSLLDLDTGTYNISAVAKAEGYLNSAPSNAVEYTVEAAEDELAGTWVFNNQPIWTSPTTYSVNFKSNNIDYTTLQTVGSVGQYSGVIKYNTTTVYYSMHPAYDEPYWNNSDHKTINITSKFAEVTNGAELLTWLKANATKQGTTSLPVWNGTDLTGTTWHVPAGWSAPSGYGKFSLDYIYDGIDLWELNIGYEIDFSEAETSVSAKSNTIQLAGYGNVVSSMPFTIPITGGKDVANLRLITWLRQNGELISHTLPEQGKIFTQGYTVTINNDTTWILADSKNEVDIMLTLLDGSCVYVYSWDNYNTATTTWTDVVALTCANYVSFTEGGLANYLENGTYFLSADITIDKLLYLNCIDENTLVTMADGSAKRLGDVEVGDDVLSIDYDTMTLISRKVIYSGKDEPDYDNWFVNCYWENVFSDGTIIKQAMNHRFYNLENELYVYMKDWNTGEHTYKLDGTNPELVSRTLVQGRINYGRITLEGSNNYFANGLSTADRRACPNKVVLNAPLQRQ